MSLIDQTYFVGDLTIAGRNKPEVAERLTLFIEKYEDEFLRDVFGFSFYKALKSQWANYPTVDQRWLDLFDGKEYEYSGRSKQYRGLLFENTDGFSSGTGQMMSPVANYVYWHWLKDQTTQTVGLGEVSSKSENASLVSPATKMVRAWNEMSEWVDELYYFMQTNYADYPEWKFGDSDFGKFRRTNTFGI